MVVAVKITVCWDVTQFSLIDMYDMSKKCAAFIIRIIHLSCRWRMQICLKCQYIPSRPYGVTFKTIVIFITMFCTEVSLVSHFSLPFFLLLLT
jgi:hypothetical protein